MGNARPWNNVFTDPPRDRGLYEVVVMTDDGPEVLILERNKRGNWIVDGEPSFCAPYYINVRLWRERAAPPTEIPEEPEA